MKQINMNSKSDYYLLIGKEDNWEISLKKKLWGFTPRHKKQWERIKSNDLLAFYVTKPTQLVIGFGIVNDKFFDKKLTWTTEKYLGEVIWPYKIFLDIIYMCNNFQDGISLPTKMNLQTSTKKIDNELFITLIENADKKWGTNIFKLINLIK